MRKSVTKAKDVTCFPSSFRTDFLMTSVTEIFSENNNNNLDSADYIHRAGSLGTHCTVCIKKTLLLLQKGNKTKYRVLLNCTKTVHYSYTVPPIDKK